MGAPKQKWTAEEESALKAGVKKHGPGKWRTILKDPEFSGILCLRSNVDLKDKWRNLSVTANGWGSREKAKAGSKSSRQISKHVNSSKEVSMEIKDMDDDMVDVKPLATSIENLHVMAVKRPFSRMDKLIQEAITSLEPAGSNQTTIAMYIEERYVCPPDFARSLSATLKELTASGRLIKTKRGWYRMAPETVVPEEGQREPPRIVKDDSRHQLRSPVDARLAWMHDMTAEEAAAAAAAAQAVAEAEEAEAQAQAATEQAEALEAEAEAAQALLQAVFLTMNNRTAADKMVLV